MDSNFGNRNSSHSYKFVKIQKQNVVHQDWAFSIHINDKMQFMLTTIIQWLTIYWQPTCIKSSIIWSQNTAHCKQHIFITLQFSVTHTSTTAKMGTFWGWWMKTDEQLIITRNKSVFPILLYVSSLLWLKKFHELHTTKIIKWSCYVFKQMAQYKTKEMQQKLVCVTKLCQLKVSKHFSILYILNYTF